MEKSVDFYARQQNSKCSIQLLSKHVLAVWYAQGFISIYMILVILVDVTIFRQIICRGTIDALMRDEKIMQTIIFYNFFHDAEKLNLELSAFQ